jgi:hypothetical protein
VDVDSAPVGVCAPVPLPADEVLRRLRVGPVEAVTVAAETPGRPLFGVEFALMSAPAIQQPTPHHAANRSRNRLLILATAHG